jgi:hypothetical protein
LEALADRDHEGHETYREWVGDTLIPRRSTWTT